MFKSIACVILLLVAANPVLGAEEKPDVADMIAKVKKYHEAVRKERDERKLRAMNEEWEKTLSACALSDGDKLRVMIALMDAKDGLDATTFQVRVFTVSRRVMKEQLAALLAKKGKTVEEWHVVMGHYVPLWAAYSGMLKGDDGQELCDILARYIENLPWKDLSVQDQAYLSWICQVCLGTPQVRNKVPLGKSLRVLAKEKGDGGELLLNIKDWVRIQDGDWPADAIEKDLLLLNHWNTGDEPYHAVQRLRDAARKGEDERAKKALFACLSDPRQQRRWFGCLGASNDPETIKLLKHMFESDPWEYVRRAAGEALISRVRGPQYAELAEFFERVAADPEQTRIMRARAKSQADYCRKALEGKDKPPGKKP